MGENSKIAWTDHTFYPWIGCSKVSAGCAHCYAEAMNKRTGGGNWGLGAPRRVTSASYWRQPLKWDREAKEAGERRKVFCASMADVFDGEAPDGALDRLWALIRQTPYLDWLLLTKRPYRIHECLPSDWDDGYPNVWIGTTIEDQSAADTRISLLLDVPAVVRFLSCEPLIGPINLASVRVADDVDLRANVLVRWADHPFGSMLTPQSRIDWVIVGGESGAGSRPMDPAWARSLRDQCQATGTAFFFKQYGGPRPGGDALLDGREWHEFATQDAPQ